MPSKSGRRGNRGIELQRVLRNKRVLITGGTGSLGHALIRRLIRSDVGCIRVFSRDEKKQYDMRHVVFPNCRRLEYMVGDVRDRNRVAQAVEGMDIVFHAAALKQVPTCEQWPMEAVQTNIIGACNVADAAVDSGTVSRFISVSTDKAVKPVNVMGMTKAIQERVVCRTTRPGFVACCVRYGNVVASRGSVVPLFMEKLAAGLPAPITVPSMTRFLLTLDDAVSLFFFALTDSTGGEVYVKKTVSATLQDIFTAVAHILGVSAPKHEIVGIRPGEKTHEILITEEELAITVDCGRFWKIHPSFFGASGEHPQREYCSADYLVDVCETERIIRTALAAGEHKDGFFTRL